MASPNRYRQRKDTNQKEITSCLESLGFDVYVMHSPMDLMAGRAGKTYCIEVKSGEKKKYTPAQVKYNATWRGHRVTLRSVEDAIQWASVTK